MVKKKLDILYEDKELLIINKEANMLTVSDGKGKEKTLYFQASSYVKKQYPKNKVFIVNRLDKETSGIVVLAKNEKMKHYLQDNWNECALLREYYAVLVGNIFPKKGEFKSYLMEDKRLFVRSTKDKLHGHLAITDYEVVKNTKAYSLVKIHIQSGRKHQIRVHFSEAGYPILGDKKYGKGNSSLRRLLLVHNKLILKIRDKEIVIETKVPKDFWRFVGGED